MGCFTDATRDGDTLQDLTKDTLSSFLHVMPGAATASLDGSKGLGACDMRKWPFLRALAGYF